jgi:hypothetical protein
MSIERKEPRQYPPLWEHAVPIIIILIALLVLGLVIVAAAVALGFFPFGG